MVTAHHAMQRREFAEVDRGGLPAALGGPYSPLRSSGGQVDAPPVAGRGRDAHQQHERAVDVLGQGVEVA